MGDLAKDTDVSGSDGSYKAQLSSDWEIWGPNGGYLAAVALRAAGAASDHSRPVSLMGHYLNVAEFDEIDIKVESVRSSRRAQSLRVGMTQRSRPIFESLIWIAAGGEGFEHDHVERLDAPGVDELRSVEEVVGDDSRTFNFWSNIESKVLEWQEGRWEDRVPGPPVYSGWFRFRPRATFDDPFVDAARYTILIDTMMYPAATMAYSTPPPYMAPSLDLAVKFHRFSPESDWLFCRAEASIADGGLVGGNAAVFGADRRLLASGGQQMLSRPWPGQG